MDNENNKGTEALENEAGASEQSEPEEVTVEEVTDTPGEDTEADGDEAEDTGSDEAEDTENAESDDAEKTEGTESAPAPKKGIVDAVGEKLGKAKKFLKAFGLPEMLLLRFVAVYFFFSAIDIPGMRGDNMDPITNWRSFVPQVDVLSTFVTMASVFVVLSVLYLMLPKKLRVMDQTMAIVSIIYFDIVVLWKANDWLLGFAVMMVSLAFIWYAVGKLRRYTLYSRTPWWISGILVLIAAVLVGFFVSLTTISRHQNFGTASHDFGIFVQMYYQLADDLTAVTTCERDRPLSHFLVHASYIFYALVPIFKLFPKAETLLIAQAVLAMGGVVPMFLIAKNHNIKGMALAFMGFAYVFCGGLIGPCYYEFHENAFLPTLLMWLLWAVDKKNYIVFYIMSVLVCIVKEDAPLYVVCIAMYVFFEEKGSIRRMHGIIMSLIAGGYMMFITNWLTVHGDGQMMTSSRFGNLMIDSSKGLSEVVKNVLIDPAYFFSLFVHEDTLPFLLQVFLPMLFLPFFTKKIRRYLLMLPFIIMNMVIGAGYGYAANIGFQYIFGPACLLLYMSIINLDDLGKAKKQEVPILMGTAAMIMSMSLFSHNINIYTGHKNNIEYYTRLEEMLSEIPKDACVAADPFLVPHIADRKELYVFDSSDADLEAGTLREPERYDFVVVPVFNEVHQAASEDFIRQGYSVYDEIPDRIRVYVKDSYLASH